MICLVSEWMQHAGCAGWVQKQFGGGTANAEEFTMKLPEAWALSGLFGPSVGLTLSRCALLGQPLAVQICS
jgi:hypothetical protein